MQPDLTFIDQTLGHAWRQGRLSFPELAVWKRKLAGLGKLLFDLPLELLEKGAGRVELDLGDVRLETGLDPERIKAASGLGCHRIKLTLHPEALAETEIPLLEEALAQAQRRGMEVAVQGLNIGKDSRDDRALFQKILAQYPIDRLIVVDAQSRLDPLSTARRVADWHDFFPGQLEYGSPNGMGLATGNALGAVHSGVRRIAVAVGGYGGFPALEEVWMGLRHLLKLPLEVPGDLAVCCREVLEKIGEPVAAAKSILGANVFAHESGIHVDGIIKKSELYEPFAPEEIGLARRIVIGKHSGKAAILRKLEEMNLSVAPGAVSRVLARVRELAVAQKGPVSDAQLRALAEEAAG